MFPIPLLTASGRPFFLSEFFLSESIEGCMNSIDGSVVMMYLMSAWHLLHKSVRTITMVGKTFLLSNDPQPIKAGSCLMKNMSLGQSHYISEKSKSKFRKSIVIQFLRRYPDKLEGFAGKMKTPLALHPDANEKLCEFTPHHYHYGDDF